MMKRFGLAILLYALFGILMTPSALAQDDSVGEQWYWAFDELAGTYSAFTAEGTVNLVGQFDGDSRPRQAWRTSPTHGFVVLDDEENPDELALFRVSSDAMERVSLDIPGSLRGTYPFLVNERASVLMNVQPRGLDRLIVSTMLVLNNETLETRLVLDLHHQSAALSRDGSKLRYARIEIQGEDVEFTSVLTELDFATGETRDVFTFPPNTTTVRPGEYGEYFMFVTNDREARRSVASSVDLEGNVAVVSEYGRGDDESRLPVMIDDTNVYVIYDPSCQENCPLTAGTFDNDERYSFIMPMVDSTITPLNLTVKGLRDAELLIESDFEFWVLESVGSNTYLGNWSGVYGRLFEEILSPDKRYLLTYSIEDEESSAFGYRVWDLQDMVVVMESDEPDNFMIILSNFLQSDLGLIVTERGQTFRLYQNGEVIDLPEIDGGFYIEMLPDGGVLFTKTRPDGEMERGMYRYDPETGDFTLLIADAIPFMSR